MSKKLGLVGMKFGKLIVDKLAYTKNGYTYWLCICECGNEKIIRGTYLTGKRRPVKSCGCLKKEKSPCNLPEHKCVTHNMSRTKFYNVWNTMVMRCHNPNSKSYTKYGAKGIFVCDRWRDFKNFYEDMFSTYKDGLSIDRIDNSKGYSSGNCRWVNMKVQNNNKSSNHIIVYKDLEYTLAEASEKFKIPYDTLKRRLYKGWDIETALSKKSKKG